jgi:hypothetical protein
MARVARNDTSHEEPAAVIPPLRLIVRCFAERKGDQWQAFSLEFGLAAQADSSAEVQAKLMHMIASYILEASTEDRAHAKALLARKGTWQVYLKFHWYRFLSLLSYARGTFTVFDELLPLEPKICPT